MIVGRAAFAFILLAFACEPLPDGELQEDTDQVSSSMRAKFTRDGAYLLLEFLDDDLLHFEVSHSGGAVGTRGYVIELVAENARATAVTLNGQAVSFTQSDGNLITVSGGVRSVQDTKMFRLELAPIAPRASMNFVCDQANTVLGESVYITGDIAELGAWSPANAVKLDPSVYPKWTGVVRNLPANATIHWKCIKRLERNATVTAWLPGADRVTSTPASGPGGTAYASF